MKKRLMLFLLQINLMCLLIAQNQSKILSTCDTITIKGYVVLLTEYNEVTRSFDTYYGFCYDSCFRKGKRFDKFQDLQDNSKNSRQVGSLTNIKKSDFIFLKNTLNETLMTNWSNGVSAISFICDTAKRNFIQNLTYGDTTNKFLELPNPESYCVKQKANINVYKPMVCIRPMTLLCISLKYESFKAFDEKELEAYRTSKPPSSFCNGSYKIDLKEIKAANKKDGYYWVLSPVHRID